MGGRHISSLNMPAHRDPLVLAVDIGTSSVRTALFDARGRCLPGSLAQRAHAVTHAPAGAAELDPATLEAGLLRCLDRTLPHARRRPVPAVGISCFWHSLVGSDRRGKLLTPIYTWADARCRHDATRLRAELSERGYHARTGCMLRASFWPAKLRWLAREQRGLFRRVARWHSPAESLLAKLCADGGDVCAHGMATGTGLYNPSTLRWDDGLLELCGLRRDQVPLLTEGALRLRPEYARKFPALAEAQWWPAIGDGAAGNLGSGATREGRAAINVGTSAAFRVMREGRVARSPFGLFAYRVDPRRFVVGGAVSNAGNLRAWCRRELNLPGADPALDDALAARPGPASSLVTLPFWSAERAPTWCEELSGLVCGLTQNTSALDLLQSTTEGVYHRLAAIADLSLAGTRPGPGKTARRPPATQIIVSGGILKSAHLLQRLADVLGRPVSPSTEPEASLRGAAVYALEKAAVAGWTEAARPGVGAQVRPRARYAALYGREREKQQRLEALMTAHPPNE